jgi:hypothetical protein
VEWGELAVQLALPILALGLLPPLAKPLASGLLVGLGANVCAAVGQLVLGGRPPVDVAGLLSGRVLLAGVVGVLAPLAFRYVIPHRSARYRPAGLALAGLVVLAVALPQSALVVGAVLVAMLAYRPLRSRCPLTAVFLLAVLLASVALHWGDFRQFVRLREADGTPRRWVQEVIASGRAIADRPLTGHGLGRYQRVVSSGEYRGTLPRPLETKVEPGMQCGYLVLAVETGVPCAAFVALALLLAGWRGLRSRIPRRKAAGLGCWALFLLLGTTPFFVRGPGFIVGAMLALAGGVGYRHRTLVWQALLLGICVVGGLAMRQPAESVASKAEEPVLPAADAATVLLAAGEPQAMPAWAQLGEDRTLTVTDGVLEPGQEYKPAVYPFSLSKPATVVLWLRASWHDGCGNSIAASFDGAPPRLVGNDGTYHVWHWVRGFEADLAAGEHELRLHPREDGLALEQILITSDLGTHPRGRLGHGGHAATEAATVQPVAPPEPTARTKPFRFGIGGCYRGGFEASLLHLGLPWGKVNDYELTDLDKLKAYDVLCLSELKEVDADRCFAALDGFVRAGGILIWENHNGHVPNRWQRSRTLLPYNVRWRLRSQTGGNQLKTDDSPLFAGIAPGTVIAVHDKVPVVRFRGQPDSAWQSYGKLISYGRDAGPAFFERKLDKGKVYFLSLPLSFHTMWKGRQFLPILNNLLVQVAGPACRPVHPQLTQTLPDRDGTWFGDDFMRAGPEVGGGWTVEGRARCTGEDHGPERVAFAVRASAPASLRAGHESWQAYRLAATVRSKDGTVALRAGTKQGEPIELVWQAKDGNLRLQQGERILKQTSLPPKDGDGWRRLSLFGQGNAWLAFADGQGVLRIDTDRPAALCGEFELDVREGDAYFDDVAVCPVAALVPGTDRALGEEGSPAAWGGLGQHGIERHTVYAMPWNARAAAGYEQALELVLPTYRGAVLRYDDSPGLRVPAGAEPATVTLPEPPQRWLAVEAPDWRDYVFSSRLTEWTPRGGDWIPLSRWSCDPEWHWVGTETATRSALWYDHPLAPPYAVNAVLSLGARQRFGEEYHRGRDLNLQLAGNGQDLDHGLSMRVMNCREQGIELWRDGQRIAQAKGVGMPSGHTLHHNWFEVGAWVETDRVRVRFEGVTVLDEQLASPVPAGQLAVWTERNSLRVARVTVAGGRTH